MSSVFKIYSPEDCDFYCDGELQGHIDGNSKKAFRFEVERKGVYRLEFINSEYQTELMMKVSIDADEEREVELDFSEVNEPVIRERERIIITIEHDSGLGEKLPKEIISAISKNGIATIPKGVKKIRNMAFWGSDITSITIPDSVTEIGDSAFFGCHSLASITIPNSVTKIGERVFYGCIRLTSVDIPDSITEIGCDVFEGCSSLRSVTIPDSVTEIGQSAFERCNSLTSVTIPNSVTKIGNRAFWGCRRLTCITIPNSVTQIGDCTFARCSSLREFNGKFASEDGRCLIIKGVLNSFATAGLTNYDIPNIATKIGYGAFARCSNLTSITIPDSVTEIGDYAFSGCCGLTSISIPNSVITIRKGAFDCCCSLASVTILDSVTWIGQGAFARCSNLTSITIPDSVTEIGEFTFYKCSSLKSIYHQATTPPILWSSFGFISNKSDLKIYVPKSEGSTVLEAYKSAKSWKDYADSIEEYDFYNE